MDRAAENPVGPVNRRRQDVNSAPTYLNIQDLHCFSGVRLIGRWCRNRHERRAISYDCAAPVEEMRLQMAGVGCAQCLSIVSIPSIGNVH